MATVWYLLRSDAIERALVHAVVALHLTSTDAEDFAQDARLFLLEKGDALESVFRAESTFDTYLYRVIWHRGLNWCRDRRRRDRRSLSLDTHTLARKDAIQLASAALPQDLDFAVHEHRQRWCADVVAHLPGCDASLLNYWLAGERMSEVAQCFKISRAAAYSRVYRILERLRADKERPRVGSPGIERQRDVQ